MSAASAASRDRRYPHDELAVFLAGYERGRAFVRRVRRREPDYLIPEEAASRDVSIFDLSREGLAMLGYEARFVPREIFEQGVLRGLRDGVRELSESAD